MCYVASAFPDKLFNHALKCVLFNSGAPKRSTIGIMGNQRKLLVVIMASGIARGRVRTTTTTDSRNMAAITETRLNLFSRPHP